MFTLNAQGNGWVDGGYLYGAGGGYSTLFPRPAWQAATVPTSAPTGRGVPDIASIADPQTGMLVGQTQTFPDGVRYGEYRIGGTSLASPLAAGAVADAVQASGKRAGLANATLYSIARSAYTDVKTSGSRAWSGRTTSTGSTRAGDLLHGPHLGPGLHPRGREGLGPGDRAGTSQRDVLAEDPGEGPGEVTVDASTGSTGGRVRRHVANAKAPDLQVRGLRVAVSTSVRGGT